MNSPSPLRFLKIAVLISLLFGTTTSLLLAQGTAGVDAKFEPRYLIDVPTAGIIPHGTMALDMDFFEHNGILATSSIGVFDRFVFGISYGGSNILGTEKPSWNSTPGFAIRLRLVDESIFIPAIACGFDSQGKEEYIDRLSRYTIKSMGFYAVASKNYSVMGYLSVHGGLNYSLERADGDDDLNFFIGAEKTLGHFLSFLGEYNLASNDSNRDALGKGRGYVNVGFRLSVGKGFSVGFNLKDIARNQQEISIGNRTFTLEYVQSL